MEMRRVPLAMLAIVSLWSIGCGAPPPAAKEEQPTTPAPVIAQAEPLATTITAQPTEVPTEKTVTALGQPASEQPEKPAKTDDGKQEPPEKNLAKLIPWTEERLTELLERRIDGGLGHTFRGFSNQFLVMCRIRMGTGVGLMTGSREVSQAELQPVFPDSYKPTLRELMNAIALQAKAEWKYDPTDKFFNSSVPGEVTDLAMFEFTPVKRDPPYEVTLAKGWTSEDKGHWVLLSPPDFPVGLDIYQVGTYSAAEDESEKELFEKVRTEVALQWANRVKENVAADQLKPAKVGEYEALYFEAMIPSQLDKDIRWRQWVFMAGNRCFFIVSTILPELDKKIFPDVEQTLKTFRLKEPAGKPN
jgi:hypothetical protein